MRFLREFQQRRQQQRQLPAPAILQDELAAWLQSPLGKRLLREEKAQLEPILNRIFGYHFLQISSSLETDLMTASPVGHKIIFSPEYRAQQQHPVADSEALPLLTDSIDAVLIHHALDFTPNSHRLLREATRVVMPGGRLLIIGFNPASLWGVSRLVHWQHKTPWNARFISSTRVTDWLKLLEFHVEKISYGAWLPWVNPVRMDKFGDKLNGIGKHVLAPLGGFYLIVASKQVVPITPIVRRWPRLRAPVLIRPIADTPRLVPAPDQHAPALPCTPRLNHPEMSLPSSGRLVPTLRRKSSFVKAC